MKRLKKDREVEIELLKHMAGTDSYIIQSCDTVSLKTEIKKTTNQNLTDNHLCSSDSEKHIPKTNKPIFKF